MGLDMYLKVSRYVSSWNHEKEETKAQYRAILGLLGIPPNPDSPGLTVEATIAYWRKANAIHGWFVEHCAEGVDNCQDTEVAREQLQELVDECKRAKLTKQTKSLKPAKGFFFGQYEINEYYWQNIDDTIDQLTAILENPAFDKDYFIYCASW